MPESTLSLKADDFRSQIGFFLGYGNGALYGETAYTTAQLLSINRCLESAQRRFYFPALPGVGVYEWSFLKPLATMSLLENAREVHLPDDFNGIDGPITVTVQQQPVTVQWWPVKTTNPGLLRVQQTNFPNMTGRPLMAAEEPIKGTGPNQGQRFKLHVFPMADQDYTLQFTYSVLPDAINASNPYPYGGATHAETFLESCLACAEEKLDDMQGVHAAAFERRLIASIAQDRRHKPQAMGYNGDGSDWQAGYGWANQSQWRNGYPAISYNGTVPGYG